MIKIYDLRLPILGRKDRVVVGLQNGVDAAATISDYLWRWQVARQTI
jgi:hypothetical protein